MPPTRINIRQLNLGPEVPLGRRGCIVESSLSHEGNDGWSDGFFACAVENGQYPQVVQLLRDRGEEVFTVIKRIAEKSTMVESNFNDQQRNSVSKLVELGVVKKGLNGELMLGCPKGNWGALLECATLIALQDLFILGKREVKVRYPYRGAPYDKDGQLYDVLVALDYSRLLSIECKKPKYVQGESNPLGQVLSVENVKKLYRRAHWLRPSIAVYLVDTKEDYRPQLQSLFGGYFRNKSGCYNEPSPPANQLMARLHGFIYFVRIDYDSNHQYLKALRESISQVLHDASHD